MLSTYEALDIILENINSINKERISVFESLNRIIAEPMASRRDLPPLDNSAMDGYALIWNDIKQIPTSLKVKGIIAAGDSIAGLKVEKGSCYKIMTGAFIPKGADTVVQYELTDNGDDHVVINTKIKKGICIRRKGEDIKIGSIINRVGECITPAHISRFVSSGIFYISVYRKPKVALISTGSEIADPSQGDSLHKTFDSNGPFIKALLTECGADVSYLGVVPDDEKQMVNLFSSLKGFDLIITSAGISVGDFDLMNIIADKLHIKWMFNSINQKPGMHMSYGKVGDTDIFACPGNPISTMFCTYFYIKPALEKMRGNINYLNRSTMVKLGKSMFKKKGRVQYDRAKIIVEDGGLVAYPFSSQDSFKIESMVDSNSFIELDNSVVGSIETGKMVKAYIYNYKSIFG